MHCSLRAFKVKKEKKQLLVLTKIRSMAKIKHKLKKKPKTKNQKTHSQRNPEGTYLLNTHKEIVCNLKGKSHFYHIRNLIQDQNITCQFSSSLEIGKKPEHTFWLTLGHCATPRAQACFIW